MATVAVFGAWVPSASAFIYWNNDATKTIGRANLDGTAVDNNFVATAYGSCSVAANGSYVYWTADDGSGNNGFVGRASTATRVAENQFIHTQDGLPCGVAVDGAHVYWNNYYQGIGRADLNGTPSSIQQTFVATPNDNVQHPSVDGGHIYYSEKGNTSIGRAPITGGSGTENFITGTNNPPSGTAVDSTYVYWGNGTYIGRATLDGTTLVQQNWLNTGNGVCAVAVDSGHIYWARYGNLANGGYIARATIDGNPASVQPTFIHTAGNTCGVAVDSGAPGPPLRPTATGVSCTYHVATFSDTCFAAVADTGTAPAVTPTGNLSFTVSGGGLFIAGSSCALMQSTSGGFPGCSVEYLPPATGTPTITATYNGDSTHAASSGSFTPLITSLGSGQLVDSLGISPLSFPAAGSGGSITKATGAKVKYDLRAPARVTFTVQRPTAGRKGKHSRCDKPTAANRTRARCTRWVTLGGSFKRIGSKGTNRFHFTGRIGGRKLKPGKYRLVATPSVGSATGRPTTASFTIKLG